MDKAKVRAVYEDGVFRPLEPLTLTEHTQVELTIERAVTLESEISDDPVLQLVGAYQSTQPLIDGIPVSDDPTLYMLAKVMGEEASGKHAWEIAPQRYYRDEDGNPVRIQGNES